MIIKTEELFILLIALSGISCDVSNKRNVIKKDNNTVISIYKKGKLIVDSIFDNRNYLIRVDEYLPKKRNPIKSKVTYYGESLGDSLVCEYLPTGGMKKKKRFYGKDMPTEEFMYSSTGELLMYSFYDSQENKFYKRNYSQNNGIVKESGLLFFEAYISPSKDYFSERDSLKALFIAPAPPDCETHLYTLQSNKSYHNIYQIDTTSMFKVEIYPLEEGDYHWDVYMELIEKRTKRITKSAMKRINFSVK